MADVGMEDTASKSIKNDYMERFKKFKESKKKTKAPLKDNSSNIRPNYNQHHTDLSKKKLKTANSVVAQQWKNKSAESTKITTTKPVKQVNSTAATSAYRQKPVKNTSQNDKEKRRNSSLNKWQNVKPWKENVQNDKPLIGNTGEKRSTPMSVRLMKWKEEKQKSGMANKRTDLQKATTKTTSECSKYLLPFGPRAGRLSMRTPVTSDKQSSDQHRKSLPAQKFTSVKPSNKKEDKPANKYKTTKPILKRRHSDAAKPEISHKRTGILKRKSCIASFNDTLADTEKCSSVETGEKNSKNAEETDDVFEKETLPPKTPDITRSVRFFSPVTDQRCSKYKKTPGKAQNSQDQASIRAKLDEWLKAKGRTPSKFRHLMCFDAELAAQKNADPKTKCSLTVDEMTEQQEAMQREDSFAMSVSDNTQGDQTAQQLESMLNECTVLFEAGCPTYHILQWLSSIEVNIPSAKTSAAYYITKAKVLQSTSDLDLVLKVFEEAVLNAAQPSQELASALTSVVKAVSEEREERASKTFLQKQVQQENIFESSSIKYCVRQVTPFTKRGRRSVDSISTPGSHCKVITPVRRSTRRSLASLPESLHDKTPVYDTLEELSDSDKKRSLYKENTALQPILLDFDDDDN